MSNVFEKDYKINIYDVDSNHKCKFSSLMNYLWDIVISQSDALGETNEGLVHNNSVWVLLKYDINIYEYPKFRDTITVGTYVSGYKKFYGYRGTTIKNSENKILSEGSSTAIIIDMEKRRPMKITPDQCEVYGLKDELKEAPPLDDIPKLDKVDFCKEYVVRYSDIDSNNHVNNVKYMEMAIDTLPREILTEYDLFNIKVIFKSEATDKDVLRVSTQVINDSINELRTLHTITSTDDKLLTKLQITWRRGC